jgi:tetratricopeptide (TPR) repeat protein
MTWSLSHRLAAAVQPAALAFLTSAAAAQAPRLGTVVFPTSGPAAAQPHFLRGVLLLHSFEYGPAAAAFREAQRVAPTFAMAYWGEAMTWTHPVWNEQNADSARAVLARLGPSASERRARAKTPRERGWLDAVETLYGEGPKPLRDTLYSLAMERLSATYPNDDEARAFYALSLMGLSQGTREVATYMRAGAIALDLFHRRPDHPGAAHYVIHAFDDPTHAPLGLPAANAYSRIAPGAPHAQHMTSHIYLALGMWDETVSANQVASGPDRAKWLPHHASSWLSYALLQQGRHAEARRLLETTRGNVGVPGRPRVRAHLASMRAHYLVNTGRWADSMVSWPIDLSDVGPLIHSVEHFALGLAALRRGDRPEAERRLRELAGLRASPSTDDPYGVNDRIPPVLAKELRAYLRLADGDTAGALAVAREAAAIQDTMPADFGPPDVVKPAHELLGEILLESGQAAEAQREFTLALAQAPRRALSLLGLARAAEAAGDRQIAARARADLERVWARADADLPGREELGRISMEAGQRELR